MTMWNNRILRHKDPKGDWYGLHEVFYDDDGKPEYCTKDSLIGAYESPKDMIEALTLMLKDAKRSKKIVLDYDLDFPSPRKK